MRKATPTTTPTFSPFIIQMGAVALTSIQEAGADGLSFGGINAAGVPAGYVGKVVDYLTYNSQITILSTGPRGPRYGAK